MNQSEWDRAKSLLAEVADLPAGDRERYVTQHCPDPELRRELLDMLASPAPLSAILTAGALAPGDRLGPYVVDRLLGRGGMGVVYRARDTRLERFVALKVLPPQLSADPVRRERFDREARAVAALHDPHICTLYDIGRDDDVNFLVMEYLDGETLASRVARGRLPVGDALTLAIDIIGALDRAHRAGVVHRDLKPANIMVTKAGAVLLDFGLARLSATPIPEGASLAATTPPMTTEGTLIGTLSYMAPEQLEGREADARSDVWAFGCVLYEMLTGSRAFEGESQASLISAIMSGTPAGLAKRVPATPSAIDRLVRTCLARNPDDRFQSSHDVLIALQWLRDADSHPAPSIDQGSTTSSSRRQLAIGLALGLIIGAIAAGMVVWLTRRPPPVQVARLMIPAPWEWFTFFPRLAISSDGSRLAYITIDGRTRRLVLRPIDVLEAKTLVARSNGPAESIVNPFFSPDGQWVAFFEDNALKKVSTTGGPVVTICPIIGSPLGGTWGQNDTIIFAASQMSPPGLWRVSAGGGAPVALTRPDLEREIGHGAPEFLPGGRGVLFTIILKNNRDDVAMLDYRTGRYKVIVRDGTDAHYASSGHLVYRVGESLHAIAFDLNRTEAAGPAVPVLESVSLPVTPSSITALRADVAMAGNGTLIYVPASSQTVARTLAWFDRRGLEEPINAPPRAYTYPRLSPDGTRVALDVRDQENDIWIWDLGRKTLTRLTFDPALDRFPLWTPDGRRVLFSSDRAGPTNIFWQLADGTGTAERVTQSPLAQFPTSISPDGAQLVVRMNAPGSTDLMAVSLGQDHQVRPLVHQSPFNEDNGEISPDGRWLAYQSNESGRFETYVRPFPNTEAGRWQASTDGGMQPLWARNGQELFYLAPTGALMRVRVARGDTWRTDTPMKLFDARYYFGTFTFIGRTYDVSPDGQRFLMIKAGTSDETVAPSQIVVVQHFDEELKRLVPK